jgi:hypothetical protein
MDKGRPWPSFFLDAKRTGRSVARVLLGRLCMTHGWDAVRWMRRCTPVAGVVWSVLGVASQAQDVVYRCGQEYTNAPRSASACERLSTQSITVVPGTRPVGFSPSTSPKAMPDAVTSGVDRTKTEPTRGATPLQTERDAQARTIVVQELDKARQQLAQLLQEYNQGEPVKWAAEARNHQKYLDRVAALKASIERTERDIDSLQRELARRPVMAKNEKP